MEHVRLTSAYRHRHKFCDQVLNVTLMVDFGNIKFLDILWKTMFDLIAKIFF